MHTQTALAMFSCSLHDMCSHLIKARKVLLSGLALRSAACHYSVMLRDSVVLNRFNHRLSIHRILGKATE